MLTQGPGLREHPLIMESAAKALSAPLMSNLLESGPWGDAALQKDIPRGFNRPMCLGRSELVL